MSVPRVAVIGLRGYGLRHVSVATRLHEAGEIEFVAGCDLAPDAELPDGVTRFVDHTAMLAEIAPDITTIATPPHTHCFLAADAIRAGSDVLVEKPPVVSLDQHRDLLTVAEETGRLCQVGFQSLASPALARLLEAVASGKLGTITGITATGAWIRTDGYYARSPWAGHRRVGDTITADGTATNPFAHAVMNALAVAETVAPDAQLTSMEAEAYRCRDIRTDDTMCARLRIGPELMVHIALTLCAEEQENPHITVHGTEGTATLHYTVGTLRLPDEVMEADIESWPTLLGDLARHRGEPDSRLYAPLRRTLPFTGFIEAFLDAREPTAVDARFLTEHDEDADRRVILSGVNEAIGFVRDRQALFSEQGVPWAEPATKVSIRL